jgi:hypothetical protein
MTTAHKDIKVLVNPEITADKLFAFYEKNDICEVGFGKDVATKILKCPHLIVAAFAGDELVGLARATHDGLSAHVMEFSLGLAYQQEKLKYENGSLIEGDQFGVGRQMGETLLSELRGMGVTFVSGYIVEDCEESFYQSLGFQENKGHLAYYIDERPYVTNS